MCYCSVGYRSSECAQALQTASTAGISGAPLPADVHNLDGSLFAWANEGRPVVRDDVPVRDVHPYNSVFGLLLNADLHPTKKEGD